MAVFPVVELRRVNLLLINYEFPPVGGGAANATWELARALVALGHRPTILTARWGARRAADLPAGVALIEVAARRKRAEACTPIEMATFMVSAGWRIRAIMRREKIDGMLAFFSIPCGPVAWWAARGTGVPYVVSLRGGDVPGTEPSLNRVHRLLSPLRRRVLRSARAVVANSPALQQRAIAADSIPVEVIPNGVDTEFFSPRPSRPAAPPFRWLFVGRLQAQKNLGWLLERLAALREPSSPAWELHVVGDGPLRAEWERLGGSLGISSRVRWHGWQSREKLREFYRCSHALVQPSLYEGMANTVLEAMACGLPVIASDEPATKELIRASGAGACLPLGDPAAAQVILRDAMRGNALDRWGNSGREYVLAQCSWSHSAAEYVRQLEPNSTSWR